MDTQVLITGAGPTGLVLALWLKEQGVKVRIIDKNSEPGAQSRATAVQARTLELYQQLGLGQKVAEAGYKAKGINLWAGGKKRVDISVGDIGANLSPFPYMLIFPQDLHERFLVNELEKRGLKVERNTELLDFSQNEDGVSAQLKHADGQVETVNTAFLTGCDGASSTVRSKVGGQFEGGTYEHLFYVADVEVEGTTFDNAVNTILEGSDFLLVMPYGEPGKLRLVGTVSGDKANDKNLDFDSVGKAPLTAAGINVEKVNWFSTYHVHHRVTDHFKHGRVFLLGDAAHVHSPAGGQGMNTGIGDAINLAWKLTHVLNGKADDQLLQSFEDERMSFAHKLVSTTDKAFSFITKEGKLAEFVRIHIAPVFMKSIYSMDAPQQAMFKVISQILLNYRESSLSEGKVGAVEGGERLPYVTFQGGSNFDALDSIGWQLHVYGSANPALEKWCQDNHVSLKQFDWKDEFEEEGLKEDTLYLLRPDTYIALVEESESISDDIKALNEYFTSRNIKLA